MKHHINNRFFSWSKMPKHLRDQLNVLARSRTIPVTSNKLVSIPKNYNNKNNPTPGYS